MLTITEGRELAMGMRKPPHPGGIVRRQCLEPLGLSVTEAARGLGVTRQALSDVVNEKASVSVEMAIRLAKAFGLTPDLWLGLQMAYDLWQAQSRAESTKVKRFASVS
jgi:addiction module HigA family antidote